MLSLAFLTEWLVATVRLSMPIYLAGLGEAYSERAGVLNINLEGMMLCGAFTSVLTALATGNPWLGLLGGLAGGVVLALVHAVAVITFKADQIISGIALNFVALGLTTFLSRWILGERRTAYAPAFERVRVPILVDLPVLGPALFNQPVLVYVGLLGLPLSIWVLSRTHFGLAVSAIGENPAAAESSGLNVAATRYKAVLICGAFGGFAGAFLSLGTLRFFIDGMTGGRGFIALAACIFGRWHPAGVLAASVLFGAADALQRRVQVLDLGINFHILQVVPHILTILVLAGIVAKRSAPAALGIPYVRGRR